PGKNHNAWWDLPQLMNQVVDAVDIFEYTHLTKVAIFIFNCSLAHKGLAPDALNINNMNIGPGGKQKHLQDTVIPLSNPPPKPGHSNTWGMKQTLVYPDNHSNKTLAGHPRRIKMVLEEYGHLTEEDVTQASVVEKTAADTNNWCCMIQVLLLQEDFCNEKPMPQTYIKKQGHVCLFLPKFHCELNPKEMVWTYAKLCDTLTIQCFFHKCWCYMDAYRQDLYASICLTCSHFVSDRVST
ncbi:hypothetical protein CONPUDRAFT_50444, partial [Coniophora puteana RWD-64-598 SS2]